MKNAKTDKAFRDFLAKQKAQGKKTKSGLAHGEKTDQNGQTVALPWWHPRAPLSK